MSIPGNQSNQANKSDEVQANKVEESGRSKTSKSGKTKKSWKARWQNTRRSGKGLVGTRTGLRKLQVRRQGMKTEQMKKSKELAGVVTENNPLKLNMSILYAVTATLLFHFTSKLIEIRMELKHQLL